MKKALIIFKNGGQITLDFSDTVEVEDLAARISWSDWALVGPVDDEVEGTLGIALEDSVDELIRRHPKPEDKDHTHDSLCHPSTYAEPETGMLLRYLDCQSVAAIIEIR